MTIAAGTVDLSRDFDRPVEAVFAAWADKDAQLVWGDPGEGWSMGFDTFSFAVGQSDICRFGPDGGPSYVNENRYLVIEPNRRIVYASSLSSEGRTSFAGTAAISFEASPTGTHMRLVEHGLYFDGLDDVEGHRAGLAAMLEGLDRYLRGF